MLPTTDSAGQQNFTWARFTSDIPSENGLTTEDIVQLFAFQQDVIAQEDQSMVLFASSSNTNDLWGFDDETTESGGEDEPTNSEETSDTPSSEDDDIRIKRWVANETETNINEILSRLYNYMKISEMDRYGINVFAKILQKYLPVLEENDIFTLCTSYWCNGTHFQCMVNYRGQRLRDNKKLKLKINDELMDGAISGGSNADKIKSMLLQWRDDIKDLKKSQKMEESFFVRNCQYRFWNHEVLVRSFLENGWLHPKLAQIALDRFAVHIHDRGMNSTCGMAYLANPYWALNQDEEEETNGEHEEEESEEDPQPPFGQRISPNEDAHAPLVSEKTVKRWKCLVETLASRGATSRLTRFKLPELRKALVLGGNTWNFIASSTQGKNKILLEACSLRLPEELWRTVSGYL